jgi:hypothetical protein
MLQRLCVIAVISVVLFPLSSVTAEEKIMAGATLKEVQNAVATNSKTGWHPINIQGYAAGKESRYNVTWSSAKFNAQWSLCIDRPVNDFIKYKAEMMSKGWVVATGGPWMLNGKEHVAAIFVKNNKK